MLSGTSSQLAQEPMGTHVPRHVAIIMDGNGRWAQQRGLPRLAGHRAGTENIRRVIECFAERGIEYLTLYAFSTENWSRPETEVRGLMEILGDVIHRETENLHRNGARLVHLGRLDRLNPELRRTIHDAVELTKDNTRITVNVAFDYGGRAEILDAVRRIVAAGHRPEEIDEKLFGLYLYTNGTPDPDLIIRTASEHRLSNFLIWQAAYAEYYSVETFWPDFGKAEIEEALRVYECRERRFGGLVPA